MNNSNIISDMLKEEEIDILPSLRKRQTELLEIIGALQNINNSDYWKVLKQFEFDGELHSLDSRLENESNTTEIFRLQGEIRRARKYDLERLLLLRRKELEAINKKLL